jgi:hypothetical protein
VGECADSWATGIIGTNHFVIDHRPEFMNLEDQREVAARLIAELPLFSFLCRPAISEGEVSNEVIPLSIANLDREETGEYQFPDSERVARFRSALEPQAGIPAASILNELEASLPVQRTGRDGHSPRLRDKPPPRRQLPKATGSHEDTVPAVPNPPAHRHHQRSRRIS